jgi:hypothetical protein
MDNAGIFNGHLVYFMAIWYIFPRFGLWYQEKSGNPAYDRELLMKTRSSLLHRWRFCKIRSIRSK